MTKLLGIDWDEAWLRRNKITRDADNSSYWDERSKDFKENSGLSVYTDIFLQYLSPPPGASILDMGSGPGTLAIPLAMAGHEVISADFSEGMRLAAQEKARERGLQNVRVVALDWNEDWTEAGIAPKSVDIAIASRSTIVENLGDALMKLDTSARKKVAITMVTEFSPRGERIRGTSDDGGEEFFADFIYGMNLLFQLGAYPELRYIDITRHNGAEMEGKLVRWAYISWKPISKS